MIIAVTGYPGAGKTHWIREQIVKAQIPVCYLSLQTESVPIDTICLKTEFPKLEILRFWEEETLLRAVKNGFITYIEIPWYSDLLTLEPLLEKLSCHRLAILPLDKRNTGWHGWADEVIPGTKLEVDKTATNDPLQIHRGILTGEVLDLNSLETFWDELTHGAYGEVMRSKGIFEVVDGQSIYGEFQKGLPEKDFFALNLPRWLEGRPTRFSGLEIIGRRLDREAISYTLQDCFLPETAIHYYQQQVKETLAEEVIV